MGYSYNKAITLRPGKERGLSTFLIALLLGCAVFVPFIIQDGGYFFFYGDFNVQQIPFYQVCHSAIRNGNIYWNSLTDLGTDFIGSYTFYLIGSPFFWLTIPFPTEVVPYLMAPLLILKFACAALTAYLFIRRFTRSAEAARLGGILYAFCGFSVYNVFFNHFHEALVFFPLLLLSLELLITENRRGFFAFVVFLCAAANYYFFFGMVIFTVIYFIIRVVSGAVKITFGTVLKIAFESVLGVALTAVILLPTVLFLMGNARLNNMLDGWNAIMYGKEQIYLNIIECFFFPPDIPARPVFFPGANVKWSSLGGWLPLFGMTGVFAWCGAKKGSWLKRIICTSFVFAMFPILNSAFSAFNASYYARWFYMPILMMCLATVMAVEDREINWGSALSWCGFITAAFALVIGFFPQKQDDGTYLFGLFTNPDSLTYQLRFWVTCGIALLSVIIMVVLCRVFKKRDTLFVNTALSFTCIIAVIYSIFFIGTGRQHSYSVDEVMIPSAVEANVELEGDADTFRIDTYDCLDNTGMFLGYQSINGFHSVVPQSIADFYTFVGEERVVASRPDTDNYGIRNLLSVKYVLNLINEDPFEETDGTVMPGYSYYGTQSGYNIYENDNYIPMGFAYDTYIPYSSAELYSEQKRALMMLKGVVLDDDAAEKYSDILSPLDTSVFYDYSEEELELDCDYLRAGAADSFSYTKTGFTATATNENETLMFFSVPYADGWSATVNGEAVEIEKANIGFMAVRCPAGYSEIVFTYRSPGLILGLKISVTAAAIFIVYIIICLITRKKRKIPVYPEGEQLIEKWLSYDVADAVENGTEDESEDEQFTLDRIADELSQQYPVQKNSEFLGGFDVNLKNDDKGIDENDKL